MVLIIMANIWMPLKRDNSHPLCFPWQLWTTRSLGWETYAKIKREWSSGLLARTLSLMGGQWGCWIVRVSSIRKLQVFENALHVTRSKGSMRCCAYLSDNLSVPRKRWERRTGASGKKTQIHFIRCEGPCSCYLFDKDVTEETANCLFPIHITS